MTHRAVHRALCRGRAPCSAPWNVAYGAHAHTSSMHTHMHMHWRAARGAQRGRRPPRPGAPVTPCTRGGTGHAPCTTPYARGIQAVTCSTVPGDDAACAAARQGGTGLARAARRRCGAAAAAQGGKQPAGCGHRARPAPLSRPATALPDARGRTARRTRLVLWRRSLRATRCHRPPSAARATSARGSWRRPHCCRRQHLCSQRRGGRSGCGDRSVGCLARGCSLSPAA
eukprot:scaffold31536_cov51-Phaeocystis_antarctica.AAC.1